MNIYIYEYIYIYVCVCEYTYKYIHIYIILFAAVLSQLRWRVVWPRNALDAWCRKFVQVVLVLTGRNIVLYMTKNDFGSEKKAQPIDITIHYQFAQYHEYDCQTESQSSYLPRSFACNGLFHRWFNLAARQRMLDPFVLPIGYMSAEASQWIRR